MVLSICLGEYVVGDNKCVQCDNTEENWLCLSCHSIHCGRFVRGHAKQHYLDTGHCVAAGFSDLSFWCYQCNSYLHHLAMKQLYEFYRDLHQMKFGEIASIEVVEFNSSSSMTSTINNNTGSESTTMHTIKEEGEEGLHDDNDNNIASLSLSSPDINSNNNNVIPEDHR